MDGQSSFSEEIRVIASALRENAPSHTVLNRASTRIDHLGRQLHGLDFVRGREIADCFTAALRELSESHRLPEEERAEGVNRAVRQLEAALDNAAAGVVGA